MDSNELLKEILARARRELLDLSGRNRLINTPRRRSRSSCVEAVGESSDQIFERLVKDRKAMTFSPSQNGERDDSEAEEVFAAPLDDACQSDNAIQTTLSADTLQKRLLRLYYDSRTALEEQGSNILYLAVGFLKWYESPTSDVERFAPLLLVPVTLERQTARSRFKLTALDEEITTNLSLQEKLKLEFDVRLPDVPDLEDLTPSSYFAQVRESISHLQRWEVCSDEQLLWLYSFAKFLMFRDLMPESWPEGKPLTGHRMVRGLLQEGMAAEPPLCGDDEPIESIVAEPCHVCDADSSQAIAIEEARTGRNLVIQGPPGTGKSQTIVNLIATAVKDGKKVLFVAEKMAALEVVKRRLDSQGLGAICLELHSQRAQKQAILQDLKQTLGLNRPRGASGKRTLVDLADCRDQLNAHVARLHTALEPSGISPYRAMSALVRLRSTGVRPTELKVNDALGWSPAERESRRALLRDLVLQIQQLGNPQSHPWRGVRLKSLLPTDVQRLLADLEPLAGRLQLLLAAIAELAKQCDHALPSSAREASMLARSVRAALEAPTLDREAIVSRTWSESRAEIDKLVASGSRHRELKHSLASQINDAAWTTSWEEVRAILGRRSWFSWLSADYRRCRRQVRAAMIEPKLAFSKQIERLDRLMEWQRHEASLLADEELGRQAFGRLWQGAASNWQNLAAICDWEAKCRAEGFDNARQIRAAIADRDRCQRQLREFAADFKQLLDDLGALFNRLDLDLRDAFGIDHVHDLSLDEMQRRLRDWIEADEQLHGWTIYLDRHRRLAAQGLQDLAEQLHTARLDATAAVDSFNLAIYEAVLAKAVRDVPELIEFDGVTHDQLAETFCRLDKECLHLARLAIAEQHFEQIPRGQEIGEVAIIRREIEKRRRHKPIRRLLREAGRTIQAIKPVFMMSPISVAQFLEPGILDFDLLVIDEASQVSPVDALGAVARARQIVVVGDDRQLPPTHFFAKTIGADEEGEESSTVDAGELESILSLCRAQGVPQRMLRWHYRSRHESLIAVSNREFYDNRLYIIPSPLRPNDETGLHFRHVPNGVFDRGETATNREEARIVAEAVVRHAEQHPRLTLGVGAFSIRQRDAILDELELLRRARPDLESFFAMGVQEPFFVKNLENIQGDERDVIFISVGYGRDASGYMTMGFGPLSLDGGERRLNVLISRARVRCEVFSSITDDDIDLNRAKSRGAAAFKAFLRYARTGNMDYGVRTERDFDSEFEADVARAIRELGYRADPQVGVAGFFVDLAVVDPDIPGRYLLAIECDGATYHSARWARDRDRLRQQVLEDRGWTVYRIWSTDWFQKPKAQIARLAEAINKARASKGVMQQASVEPVVLRTSNAPAVAKSISEPYQEAAFDLSTARPLVELSAHELAVIATQVVRVEGPVHEDEVARRLAGLWGYGRTGSRIVDAVKEALSEATSRGWVKSDGPFYTCYDANGALVRNRESVTSPTLRRAEMLPPSELQRALTYIISTHGGTGPDEAVVETARLLGFRSTGGQLKQVLLREIERLIEEGELQRDNDKLYAPNTQQS